MADDPGGWLFGLGGGGTAAALIFGIWDRFFRQKKETDDADKAERDAVRINLGAREMAVMDRLERDIARRDADIARKDQEIARERLRSDDYEKQRDDAERGKDRAWDVARAWKTRTHNVKHELANARTMIDGQLALQGREPVRWFDETLPALEDIEADNARRKAARDEWGGGQAQPDE